MYGNLIEVTIGELIKGLQGMMGVFVGTSYWLAGLAFMLTALGGVYKWWVEGSFEELASGFVRTLILAAPVMVLLNGWTGYMQSVAKTFHKDLPSAISGITGGSPTAIIDNAIRNFSKAVEIKPPEPNQNNTTSGGGGFVDDVFASISGLTDRIEKFVKYDLYNMFARLLVFILNAILIFGILFAIMMPIASLYIGAIFGPLLVVWLLWRPMADLATRWFSFMLANGINFVVAIVILAAMNNAFANMADTVSKMMADSFITGFLGIMVNLVALFAIYIFSTNLMLSANNIAMGMTGGAAVGEGLFGKISAAYAARGIIGTPGTVKSTGGAASRDAMQIPGAIGQVTQAVGQKLGSETLQRAGGALVSAQNRINAAMGKAGSVLDKAKEGLNKSRTYQVLKNTEVKRF